MRTFVLVALVAALAVAQSAPENVCCYRFANPQLPSLNVPSTFSGDSSLTGSNSIVLANGQPLSQTCNGNTFEYFDGTQWKSSYVDKNGQTRSSIDNLYATGYQINLRTIQSYQDNLSSLLTGKYGRLWITCNNGQRSCVQFVINGSPSATANAQCGTSAPTTTTTTAAPTTTTTTVAPTSSPSPCIRYNNPAGAISTTGTWSILSRVVDDACLPINIAGMRGITPNNNTQVSLTQPNGLYLRVKQAFLNMIYNAESFGARSNDCARVVVFVRDMVSIRPVVNQVQTEIWGAVTASNPTPYPPRTILQIDAFNGLTCEYSTGNKWRQGTAGPNGQVVCEEGGIPIGDILEVEGTFYVR